MSDVVWSINIMCAILLVAVGYSIYWIFKYDTWYPNDITVHSDDVHGTDNTTSESM